MCKINFTAEYEASFGIKSQIQPSDLPEIVFSGRSNVGKSSLINKLASRRNLARTSSTPGKTGTINFFKLDGFRFVDLPGYGYAKVSHSEKKRWAKLVEGYFEQDRNIALVVQLIDMRHPPTKDDMAMIDFLCDYSFPFVVVTTKSDKLNKTETLKRNEELKKEFEFYEGIQLVPFSSSTGQGADELKRIILSAVEQREGMVD